MFLLSHRCESLAASKIVSLARECLGTPYEHQGRQIGVALDCAGLVAHILDGLNLPYNDMRGYPRTPYKGMLKAALDKEPSLERIHTLEPDCILLLRITRDPQHLALFTGDTIIHSYLTAEKVTEHGLSDSWKKRIVAMYRIKIDE